MAIAKRGLMLMEMSPFKDVNVARGGLSGEDCFVV